jgi:anti-anti-sigma factor
MRISVSFKDDVAIVALTGKFVAGSDGPFLRQKVKDLIDAGAKKLVLDFTEVPYIDSTGLGFLAGSRVTAQNAGVSVVLAGVNQHVRRILDGVRLTPFFVLAANEVEAVSMVNANPAPDAGSSPPKRQRRARSSEKNSS